MVKKRVGAILIDIALLLVVVLAVYMLLVENFINLNTNLLYAIIILAIPTGFYLTYMAFAKQIDWDAPYREDEEEEDEATEAEEDDYILK